MEEHSATMVSLQKLLDLQVDWNFIPAPQIGETGAISYRGRSLQSIIKEILSRYMACFHYEDVDLFCIWLFSFHGSFNKLLPGRYFTSTERGIGISFQLAIIASRINLIDYDIASAQRYRSWNWFIYRYIELHLQSMVSWREKTLAIRCHVHNYGPL